MIFFNTNHARAKTANSILTVLLCLILLVSVFVLDMPESHAENGDTQQQTEGVQPDETEERPQDEDEPPHDGGEEPAQDEPDASEQPVYKAEKTGGDTAEPLYVEGEVIVKFKQSASSSAIASTLSAAKSKSKKKLHLKNTMVAQVPKGDTVKGFVKSLEKLPNVEYAQPNYVYTLQGTVNDPLVEYQWHLDDISIYDAWDITMGSSDIKVAVLDTGIKNPTHAEFGTQIHLVWNALNENSTVVDEHGHGTHVAGIIAAKANNGVGVAGVAADVNLIIVDVFDENPDEPGTTTENVINGINYAIENGAHVINMSLGGQGYDQAFEEAVDKAAEENVVVISAAGNKNTNAYYIPSDFESGISVIATNEDRVKADFSNWGEFKDISAPGVDILSTYFNNIPNHGHSDYAFLSGTSMAAPIVSGIVALMLSVNPSLTVDEVKSILYATADDVYGSHDGVDYDIGWDQWTGHGIVNARDAVFGATRPQMTVTPQSGSIDLSWDVVPHATGYAVYRSTSESSGYSKVADVSGGSIGTWTDASAVAGTTYYYKLSARRNADGKDIDSCDSAVQSGQIDTLFAQGDGSEDDPYGISTPEQLNAVRYYPEAHFVLLNDIDMSDATGEGGVYWNDGAGWEPIGNSVSPFVGIFDGNDFTVNNIYINRQEQNYVGLFGNLDTPGSIIKNLKMNSYSITGRNYVGAIVGYSRAEVSSCHTDGEINGNDYVGGMTGKNTGVISDCISAGQVIGQKYSGGISGESLSAISNCKNTAAVGALTSSAGGSAGGIVGNNYSDIINSHNDGVVYATTRCGGIAGSSYNGLIAYCSNTQVVRRSQYASVGGIVGYLSGGTVTRSYNTGWLWAIQTQAITKAEVEGLLVSVQQEAL